jgi:hypothetical protein
MAKGPQTVEISTSFIGGTIPTRGRGLALLAAHVQSGTLVDTNIPKRVRLKSQAEAFFGAGSVLATGFEAAQKSGVNEATLIGVDPDATGTETFPSPAQTGTITGIDDDNPISVVTAADDNGTPFDVISYTHVSPPVIPTPSSGTEIVINLETGEWAADAPGTAAGITIEYTVHAWSDAFAELDMEAYEYAVPAGLEFNAQNHGIFQLFLRHADEEKKLVAAALDSGALPADVQALVESTRNSRLFLLAAYYTGDLTSAIAGVLAVSPTRSSRKLQPAPAGVTYTDTYTHADYGDEEDPVTGTFHDIGVNAVYENPFDDFEITNDRACEDYTADDRFHSTRRIINTAEVGAEERLLALRRSSDVAVPLNQSGIKTTEGELRAFLTAYRDDGNITTFIIRSPDEDDITADDSSKRIMDGFDVEIQPAQQTHLWKLDLEAVI